MSLPRSPTCPEWMNIVPDSSIRLEPVNVSCIGSKTLSLFGSGSSSSSSSGDTSTSVDNSNSIGNDSYTNANGGAVNSTNNPVGAGCSSGDIGTTLGSDTSVGGVGNAEGLIYGGEFNDWGFNDDRDESIIDDKGHSTKKGGSNAEKSTKENWYNGDKNGMYSLYCFIVMSFYFYCYCI